MPRSMVGFIERSYHMIWHDLQRSIVDTYLMLDMHGHGRKMFREHSLRHWPTSFPQFWPEGERYPWVKRWFIARFLHAMQPADTTFFMNMRDPLCRQSIAS